jgi:hypothetical protein
MLCPYKIFIRPLAKVDFRPPSPPILGGTWNSKSPRIGGFRGLSKIYARGLLNQSVTLTLLLLKKEMWNEGNQRDRFLILVTPTSVCF